MRTRTFAIVEGTTTVGFQMSTVSGQVETRYVAYPSLPRVEFATFMSDTSSARSLVDQLNVGERLHSTTPWSFANWAAEQTGGAVSLFRLDLTWQSTWPGNPNLVSGWASWDVEINWPNTGAETVGTLYRAIEARDDVWARRQADVPGGPAQRIRELVAFKKSAADGFPVPYPIFVPEQKHVPLTSQPVEPTYSVAAAHIGASDLVMWVSEGQWTEMIDTANAPRTVSGTAPSTTGWVDAVPPFDGLAPFEVNRLSVTNLDATQTLLVRFGPAGTVVQIAPQSTWTPLMTGCQTITFSDRSRLQVSDPAAVDYTIEYVRASRCSRTS
jgi:hypothetical protein